MATSPLAPVAPHLRRARVGVALIFFTNGIVLGGFAPRVPEIRANLGISYGTLGVAMAMWSIGALALGLFAANLIRRFGSGKVATLTMLASAGAMLAAGAAPNVWLFGAALFLVGVTDAWVDVAQNAHGLQVQKLYKRSILNAFHGLWSIGAVAGGLIGGLFAGLGWAVPWQFALSLVIVIIVNLVAYPMLLPKDAAAEAEVDEAAAESAVPQHTPLRKIPLRTWGVLLALTIIAIGGGWAEDAAATWSASYMQDELLAGAGLAAFAFIAMQGSQFIGRMVGDGMVDRWGQRAVARFGGLLVAVGMGLALAFQSPWGTIAGFGAAGFGVATLIPGAMHAADEIPGLREGTGLTILSWLLRLAFLMSPPVVGWIADATSLRVGLSLVPVFGVLVVLLAGVMAPRKASGAVTAAA
ncbi:MFS transporter [Demequina sp. NBRC 110051]|uniref:MFS transporter n=1 Tax=Demequina sp. NBRC 110051 TaxID=1570340 RepID=UPI0009FC03DA|nr:MFS transporter [Demequina sp. NBRC 110051]